MKSLLKLLFFVLFCYNLFAETPEKIFEHLNKMILDVPKSTKMAVMIYNPLTQDTLFSINHTTSMIPASNTKLFTTATALELMGGDYLISTKLFADDKDFSDGRLDGNIYLKGFGNPTFTTEDLEELVSKLYQSGLRKITGNIYGDDTFFDNVYSRDDWISEEKANVTLPPISALIIDRNRTIVSKKRKGRYRNYFVNVQDPPLFAAKKLKEKLVEFGIESDGKTLSGQTPGNAIPLLESSIELRKLIQEINKHSDNFYAECLFKTVGSVFSGRQGNSFYSTQAILNFIEDNSIYSTGTKLVDGSGISRFDQVTAGAIVGLLEKVYFNIDQYDDFFNSLSIAGVDGTLHRRMISTLAENNFRGKTGTLNGVSSLAGYIRTSNDDDLIVCIMFEFKEGGANKHKNIQDKIVEYLAELKN
ncbi:MAG: D-alanyl-D-alanine carboxypeptidase/D-alanyl-D-alanine-endopeptidase [Ignavibacteriota bacterium]|jgi:D-alanyl-D-alanine carboxypeptidase/D-alanyl-D-alanine-endopeptidase (penicillin-binding protein 4)|nr:MAG: D-alanyl-D-alanine carboxypeptidase/D-alanyl-D-alanine-endopeptidase [Chlorobiota bacterium]MBE7476770.1 D-alanyl-D-alanine carboxypeptidase/D-alanyl-D-alanine-endopeptidase [Ignavibacteriales bacterium]MBL1121977.1 D-alanyl-D-alanine carboxypeptidase/D-alanyl-D-alanine-endopeptidase [Ignavibacteriota bacterium]MCC7092771.1 D-alanyl-D-alanine carboxypeptidase/D-alanyl-D-alanine-endopeptidase [Ignavibacteriaceae bacterium]MCE7856401.1 D-alanyl-D-alanine carboxypeptidase/D-alanyl-D-alanin